MSRTVASGWGSAEAGGAYTVSDGGNASVSPRAGRLELAAPGTATWAKLPGAKAADIDGRVTFALPAIQSGGTGVYIALTAREADGKAYRAKARVLPGGVVRLSFSRVGSGGESFVGGETELPFRLGAEQAVVLRTRVTGTDPVTLRSKAWPANTTEPAGWQHVATDAGEQRLTSAGSLGIWSYVSRGGTIGSIVIGGFVVDTAGAAATPSATASANPAPTATATVTPKPSTNGKRRSAGAGAAPIGSTNYAVPAGAVIVSPSGNDSGAGTVASPLRTVAQAIAKAPSGGTVVLRAGTYHETVTVPAAKRLTIQSYPGEAAWFDGSSRVTGWTASGGVWTHAGWTAEFDASPSYTKGAKPNSDYTWQFVDKNYPMASHPDQVWAGGTALTQVGSLGQVKKGTFYADYGANRLYVGSDPTGQDIRASDLSEAITIRSAGSVLRGVGVRRYATSIPQMGSVKIAATGVTVENVAVTDSATTGLSALAGNVTMRHITASRSGMLGIHANYADNLRLAAVRTEDNNRERFKSSPVSGGIKVTRSRHVAVVDSVTADNLGKGIWMDESVYDITLTGNDITGNSSHGISLELCAKIVVADNLISDNAGDGLRVNDTAGVQIWNNTLTGNGRTINLVQDDRRAANLSTPGHDPRQKLPDPTMTWLLGQITVGNNTIADARSGATCLLCVEDYSHQRSAAQMQIKADGNIYTRPNSGNPSWLVVWSKGAGNPAAYTSIGAFQSATGQESHGVAVTRPTAIQADGSLHDSLTADAATAARPLPEAIATLVGRQPATRHMGAWAI